MTVVIEAVAIPALEAFYVARNNGESSRAQCLAALTAGLPVILHQVMGRIIEHREELLGADGGFNLEDYEQGMLDGIDAVLTVIRTQVPPQVPQGYSADYADRIAGALIAPWALQMIPADLAHQIASAAAAQGYQLAYGVTR